MLSSVQKISIKGELILKEGGQTMHTDANAFQCKVNTQVKVSYKLVEPFARVYSWKCTVEDRHRSPRIMWPNNIYTRYGRSSSFVRRGRANVTMPMQMQCYSSPPPLVVHCTPASDNELIIVCTPTSSKQYYFTLKASGERVCSFSIYCE